MVILSRKEGSAYYLLPEMIFRERRLIRKEFEGRFTALFAVLGSIGYYIAALPGFGRRVYPVADTGEPPVSELVTVTCVIVPPARREMASGYGYRGPKGRPPYRRRNRR